MKRQAQLVHSLAAIGDHACALCESLLLTGMRGEDLVPPKLQAHVTWEAPMNNAHSLSDVRVESLDINLQVGSQQQPVCQTAQIWQTSEFNSTHERNCLTPQLA